MIQINRLDLSVHHPQIVCRCFGVSLLRGLVPFIVLTPVISPLNTFSNPSKKSTIIEYPLILKQQTSQRPRRNPKVETAAEVT